MAADGSYLSHFRDWFGGHHSHWFMQLFWFAIIVTFAAESVYAWQTIQYGRDELSPGRSQREHTRFGSGAGAIAPKA